MTWASSQGSISLIDEAMKGYKFGKQLRDDWDEYRREDNIKAAEDEDRAKEKERLKQGPPQATPATPPTEPAPAPTAPTYNDPPADLSTVPHPGMKKKPTESQPDEDARER